MERKINMSIRAQENVIGAWAFFAGVILALAIGIFLGSKTSPIMLLILVALGVVVGFFVSEQDVKTFLLASVSVVIVSYAGVSGFVLDSAMRGVLLDATIRGVSIGKMLSSVLASFIILFVPATVVVAIKTVFSLAKR